MSVRRQPIDLQEIPHDPVECRRGENDRRHGLTMIADRPCVNEADVIGMGFHSQAGCKRIGHVENFEVVGHCGVSPCCSLVSAGGAYYRFVYQHNHALLHRLCIKCHALQIPKSIADPLALVVKFSCGGEALSSDGGNTLQRNDDYALDFKRGVSHRAAIQPHARTISQFGLRNVSNEKLRSRIRLGHFGLGRFVHAHESKSINQQVAA